MSLPDAAWAGALGVLPGMGPAGLHRLLASLGPKGAWDAVLSGEVVRPTRTAGPAGHAGSDTGRLAPRGQSWSGAASQLDVGALWARWRCAGIGVLWAGDQRWPSRLARDPEPPGVVWWRGSLDALDRPTVALVGTRRATPEGRRLASRLGSDLAAAGVAVVSGLALGIDGAAHRGALATGRPPATVGVAASGVDRPYPARHAGLWAEVAAAGLLVSETPPGHAAQAWRFPARNRVIAGLSQVVVVVESHERGGALLTADAALERGVDVRAVPGPVGSPASAGTNQLLCDGAAPVRDATDVLEALGTFRPRPVGRRSGAGRPAAAGRQGRLRVDAGPGTGGPGRRDGAGGVPPATEDPGRALGGDEPVLAAVGWQPTSLNGVVRSCGLDVGRVAAALERLEAAGAVAGERGWWQRLGAADRLRGRGGGRPQEAGGQARPTRPGASGGGR